MLIVKKIFNSKISMKNIIIKSISFAMVAIGFSFCSPKKKDAGSEKPPIQLTIVICKKILDNAEGETWAEKGRIKLTFNTDIQRLIDLKSGKIPIPEEGVPLCGYKDLLVFLDENGETLFGIAEKTCADWIRISDCHSKGVGFFHIGGEQDFNSIKYIHDVKITQEIRAKLEGS